MMNLSHFGDRLMPVDDQHHAIQLRPAEIPLYWEELADILEPAVEVSKGDLSVFGLLHSCAHEHAYMFVFLQGEKIKGALVASLHVYHTTRVCHIDAYAGNLVEHYSYMRSLEIWALANGCEYMEGYGSAAAERLARRHGFVHTHHVYRKPLGTAGNTIQ
jgi:hypothetical protein